MSEQVSNDIEKAKLREEVKALKQQRLIAALSAVGAVIAFLVTNYTALMDIFYPAPKIKLVVEDTYLQRIGNVSITPNVKDNATPVVKTSVAETRDWIPMQAGSYKLKIIADNHTFFQKDILLKAGDKESYFIPEIKDQRIHLTIHNHTPKPMPGEPLEFRIESSGNGYLWVYFLPPQGSPELVYPKTGIIGSSRHMIKTSAAFHLPDSQNDTVMASNTPEEETLLFIVTSSAERTQADTIASRMSAASITKASATTIRENWGASLLRYRVEL